MTIVDKTTESSKASPSEKHPFNSVAPASGDMDSGSTGWVAVSSSLEAPKHKISLEPVPGAAVYSSTSGPDKCKPSAKELVIGDGIAAPQKVLFPAEKICLKWQKMHRVGAGLQNLGNTCFLNSALQCLTYTPPLANYMLSYEHSKTCHEQGFCMMCTMQGHINQALSNSGTVIKPMSVINELRLKCMNCKGVSDTFDPYLDITLEIKEVKYPEYLDIRPYMSQPNGEPIIYALYAVLVHTGFSCHAGHYYCYIKASNGQWYQMNDSTVSNSDIRTVLNQQAYVLFYIRTHDLKNGAEHIHSVHTPGQSSPRPVINQRVIGNKQSNPGFIGPQLPPHMVKNSNHLNGTGSLKETPSSTAAISSNASLVKSPSAPSLSISKWTMNRSATAGPPDSSKKPKLTLSIHNNKLPARQSVSHPSCTLESLNKPAPSSTISNPSAVQSTSSTSAVSSAANQVSKPAAPGKSASKLIMNGKAKHSPSLLVPYGAESSEESEEESKGLLKENGHVKVSNGILLDTAAGGLEDLCTPCHKPEKEGSQPELPQNITVMGSPKALSSVPEEDVSDSFRYKQSKTFPWDSSQCSKTENKPADGGEPLHRSLEKLGPKEKAHGYKKTDQEYYRPKRKHSETEEEEEEEEEADGAGGRSQPDGHCSKQRCAYSRERGKQQEQPRREYHGTSYYRFPGSPDPARSLGKYPPYRSRSRGQTDSERNRPSYGKGGERSWSRERYYQETPRRWDACRSYSYYYSASHVPRHNQERKPTHSERDYSKSSHVYSSPYSKYDYYKSRLSHNLDRKRRVSPSPEASDCAPEKKLPKILPDPSLNELKGRKRKKSKKKKKLKDKHKEKESR
ncbi:hypothetical protein E2320_012141 [Naja naja]|nr:hypothetical protein E2320_012141 [Naja naja]